MKRSIAIAIAVSCAGCTALLDMPLKDTDTGDALPDVVPDSIDTGTDAPFDTWPDTTPDSVPDTVPDSVPDTAPDTAPDTTPDTTADTAPDTDPDTVPDTAEDTEPDTAPDTAPDTTPDTVPDTAVDTVVDSGIDTAVDTIADTATDDAADGSEADLVCARWNLDRAYLGEGTWTGSVSGCNEGDITGGGRENALRQVNLYRWLADLPAVVTDAAMNADTQECALMMHANGALDHTPPTSWTCYTTAGADAAGASNISSGQAVESIDMYMSDFGNATTMGHRRWILSEGLGPIGIGGTSGYSCLQVIHWPTGGTWTAWPAPGAFPVQAMDMPWYTVDETGWTLQSNTISLSSAVVTVTDAGSPRPVLVTVLLANYGSQYAISFIPQGWTSLAGHTYHVSVTGVTTPISYDVEMVDCG